MGITAVWRKNLKALVDREGNGKSRAGLRAVADETGLSEEYLYQIYSDKSKRDKARVLGVEAAERISQQFGEGRPAWWFDVDPDSLQPTAKGQSVASADEILDRLAALLQSIPDTHRDAVSQRLHALALAPDSAQLLASLKAAFSPNGDNGGPAKLKPEHQESVDRRTAAAEERHAREQKQRRPISRR